MEQAALAARSLATQRHKIGSEGPIASNPLANVAQVLEAGLIVVYARSFTGNASLGDRWRPKSSADRALHNALIAARDSIHAHADHTPHRSIIEFAEAQGGISFGPEPALAWTQIPGDVLLQVAGLCDRQRERFEAEASRLYPLFRGPHS